MLQLKPGSRRGAMLPALGQGADLELRKARSPPGAGENDKRPMNPKNEVWCDSCIVLGFGARKTLTRGTACWSHHPGGVSPEAMGNDPSYPRDAFPLLPCPLPDSI